MDTNLSTITAFTCRVCGFESVVDLPLSVLLSAVCRFCGNVLHTTYGDVNAPITLDDLAASIRGSNPAAAIRIAAQVARELAGLHDRGKPLGFLSPKRVLIDHSGRVVLLPSACADCATPVSWYCEHTGVIEESCKYLAPEQFWARSPYDALAADVYALGCVFYFVSTGQEPFAGLSIPQTAVSKSRRALYPLQSDVPVGLLALVKKMTAPRPSDRFPNARAVVSALPTVL